MSGKNTLSVLWPWVGVGPVCPGHVSLEDDGAYYIYVYTYFPTYMKQIYYTIIYSITITNRQVG